MTDDSRHSAAQSSSETPDDAVTVTAHGAVVTVASDGVHVHRTPMGRTLLPPELTVRRDQLRGWYHHAPTAASPGWIQFSLQDIPEFGVARPLRGYPATHGVSTVVAFAPGQDSEFTAVHAALTALQSGLRPEDATLALPGDAGPLPATAVGDADSTAPASGGVATTAGVGDSGGDRSSGSPTSPGTGRPDRGGRQGARHSGGGDWKRVSTPDVVPEPDLTADADSPVFGQNVTVTGDFDPYSKGEVWDMIAAAGGTVGKNVTKKTTVLVVGTWESVTSKEKRARELNEKGQGIEIWSFDEFLDKIGRPRRPDFSEVRDTDAPF